jgi:hypothetical protein
MRKEMLAPVRRLRLQIDRILPVAVAIALMCLAGCASTAARPATSSYGCMQKVIEEKLPKGLADERAHCMASALIARYCSKGEAYLAGAGKELRDLFGPGDAQWRDWRADRAGIACANDISADAEIADCCSARGY